MEMTEFETKMPDSKMLTNIYQISTTFDFRGWLNSVRLFVLI